jgi:hypothetical protein
MLAAETASLGPRDVEQPIAKDILMNFLSS